MSAHDRFELRIFFRRNPILTWETARPFLETLLRESGELAPTRFHARHDASEPIALELIAKQFAQREPPDKLWFSDPENLGVDIVGYDTDRDPGAKLLLRVPFSRVAGRAEQLVHLVTELCRLVPAQYGWGHSKEDLSLAKEPNVRSAWGPKAVHEAYWLTILGRPMVEQLGRARVGATPAHRIEMLPDGSALIVTSPDPGDVFSRAAREAQARATAHLRPDVDEATHLRGLLARSATLVPVIAATPAPIAPPTITEWRPAAEALASDVDDVGAAIRGYVDEAEAYIAGFHDQIEALDEQSARSLTQLDEHFLERDYWSQHDVAMVEQLLVPALGAYLGRMLVDALGGRWVPRRALEESQVIVGARAWLPFLRVKHLVQSRAAARAHSLAAFFAAAKQHAAG